MAAPKGKGWSKARRAAFDSARAAKSAAGREGQAGRGRPRMPARANDRVQALVQDAHTFAVVTEALSHLDDDQALRVIRAAAVLLGVRIER